MRTESGHTTAQWKCVAVSEGAASEQMLTSGSGTAVRAQVTCCQIITSNNPSHMTFLDTDAVGSSW